MAAARTVIEKRGRLDITVNSAGHGEHGDFMLTEPPTVRQRELYEFMVKLNLVGSYDVGRISAYEMTKNPPNEYGERGIILSVINNCEMVRASSFRLSAPE